MKRFDAGLRRRATFIDDEMGEMLALKAWYCDSTHRYAMTDAVQPLIVTSAGARSRAENPKADLAAITCWRMAATSSTRRAIFAGEIVAVEARLDASASARVAGSSTWNSPTARSATST